MAISKSFLDLVSGSRSYGSSTSFGRNKSVRRRNIVYSNELVKDIKLLRRCRSLESIDIYLDNRINELETIESISNRYIRDLAIKNRRALEIQRRVSLEAANLYYYSLEAMPDVKGAAAAAGEGIKKFFEKLLAIIVGFGKRIASWVNGFFVSRYNKFYKDFNAAKFQNLSATVNVPPIPKDVVNKMKTSISSKGIQQIQKLTERIQNGKDISVDSINTLTEAANGINPNEIFAEIFGNSELKGMPKNREMTVSEFFHKAKAGQKPAMLEVLSPAMKDLWNADMKAIKELSGVCKAAMNRVKEVESKAAGENKEGMKEYNKAASALRLALTKMQARRFNDFNAKAKIAGVIYSVAKTGCGEAKKQEGKK